MKLCNFTKPELQYFIDNCNFTDIEMRYVELRSKDKSNVAIANELNISTSSVSNVAKRVKDKIEKIK